MPRTIFKKDLEQRLSLKTKIDALRREANDLAKQLAKLDADIFAYVEAKADKSRSLVRSGFRLAIETAKKSVSWKSLFAECHTREQVAAAEEAAGTKEVLKIEKL